MSLHILPIRQNTLRLLAAPTWAPRHRVLPALVATLVLWRQRRRTRQQLSILDDRALSDVGLSRAQQRIEGSRPFWF